MSAIPDRVWELLTPDEKENLELALASVFRPTVRCPNCDAEVRVRISLKLGLVDLDTQPKTPPHAVTRRGSIELRILEAARTSGLMDAFISAMKAEKEHSGVPSDPDGFFLEFWNNAKPTKVSSVILATWIDEHGGRVEAWQWQGIVAVMSDGELVQFVPNRLTLPQSVQGVGPRPKLSNAASFDLWTKNKFGYVPVSARGFGEALRQKNIGAFGKLVQ